MITVHGHILRYKTDQIQGDPAHAADLRDLRGNTEVDPAYDDPG